MDLGAAYARVMARTERTPSGCLEWQGARDRGGHGRISVDDRVVTVSRIVAEYHYGPSELCALHSCDNPPCVEPTHLRWGSKLENTHDALTRGRMPGVPLTPEQRAEIRASTDSERALAARYGVSKTGIRRIRASLS